jgi:hypothetical protein
LLNLKTLAQPFVKKETSSEQFIKTQKKFNVFASNKSKFADSFQAEKCDRKLPDSTGQDDW